MSKKNSKNEKNFLVSTADFAFYVDDILACTGTTNLNASLEVSMEEQEVKGGKGNKLLYAFKYGRALSATLEAADWKLEYIAMASGSKITEGMRDVYKLRECVMLTDGIGVLSTTPIGDVAVELANGTIVTVKPEGTTIDMTKYGLTTDKESVKATYKYSRNAKSITIDAESTPFVGRLVLDADKHNNKLGKVGSVQIEIPSYQLNGNFNIEFTPDGVTSTSLEGKALAVEGDTCADGSVYAYITEFDETEKAISVTEIAATPADMKLNTGDTKEISVIGLKGALYSPIQLDNTDCVFISDNSDAVTISETGVVTAKASGSAMITIEYDGKNDTIDVIVDGVITTKKDEMSKDILTVANPTDVMLGKSVSDMIGNDVKVMEDGSVTGVLKYVDGFTDFSSKTSEQSGHYFPVKLNKAGTKMTIKTNGVAKANKANIDFDPELLLRVSNNDTTFTVEVDGTEVVTFNFKDTTLAQ